MKTARIILLDGGGSSGKTSLARALQALLDDAFLHVRMDAFLNMLPARYLNDPSGFTFASSVEDGRPVTAIRSGATDDGRWTACGTPSSRWRIRATI